MAQKFYNESDIQAIASAIREKNGLSNTYTVSQMASAIQGISSGGGGNTDIEDGLITKTVSTYENSRVTTIGDWAFCRYIILASVNFPKVTTIGNNTFYSCSALASISFPQTTTIGFSAFAFCSALASVNFPKVTTIGISAFYCCENLASISFPQTTTIGSSAFAFCSALASVNFPQVTTINGQAFDRCQALTSISFPQATTISNYTFRFCLALTSVDFPQVTIIGNGAFFQCSALTSISFPQATTINGQAFAYCSKLTSVDLGGEESQSGQLYSNCFQGCYNLISLTLQGSHIYSLMNSNALSSTPIAGYSAAAGQYGSIFVPVSLYSQYISATNWAYFSSRIISRSTAGGGSN